MLDSQSRRAGAGARVLRQDPVECLFQFVCSSNNHISRIHGMVERLCSAYGTPLPVLDTAAAAGLPEAGLNLMAVALRGTTFHATLQRLRLNTAVAACDMPTELHVA